MARGDYTSKGGKIVRIDEDRIKEHFGEIVRSRVAGSGLFCLGEDRGQVLNLDVSKEDLPFHGLPDPLVPFDPVSRYISGKQLAKPGTVYNGTGPMGIQALKVWPCESNIIYPG